MIFAAFLRIRLKRTNSGSKALLFLVTANFIACTAFIAVDVTASQTNASLGLAFAANVIYMIIDLISQTILVNILSYIRFSLPLTDASGFQNKDIPMLDHVAPTMDYGSPDPVNTCILRCNLNFEIFSNLKLMHL